MSIRDVVQKSPAVSILACVIIFGAAVLLTARNATPAGSTPAPQVWFYDLSTGQLITKDRQSVPPINADGSTAVRARVYGCDGCGEGDRHVVVIEKYPDAAAEQLRQTLPADATQGEVDAFDARRSRLLDEALLIAAPPQTPGDDIIWTPHASPQAKDIRSRLDDLCPDSVAELCEIP